MDKELLKKIYELASMAYWQERSHCGGDYDDKRCVECDHCRACEIEVDLNNALFH